MTALLFHSLCKCDICIQNVHDGFPDKRLLPDLGREYMLRYRYTVYIQQGSDSTATLCQVLSMLNVQPYLKLELYVITLIMLGDWINCLMLLILTFSWSLFFHLLVEFKHFIMDLESLLSALVETLQCILKQIIPNFKLFYAYIFCLKLRTSVHCSVWNKDINISSKSYKKSFATYCKR